MIAGLLDHRFQYGQGRKLSGLARRLGAYRLDVTEMAVHEALLRVMQTWTDRGTPDDPVAWLGRVIPYRVIDVRRKDTQAQSLAVRARPDSEANGEIEPA